MVVVSIKHLRKAVRQRLPKMKRPQLIRILGIEGAGMTEDMEKLLDDLPDDLQTGILELAGAKEPPPLPVPEPNQATRARWDAAARLQNSVNDTIDSFMARNERNRFRAKVANIEEANAQQRKAERRRVERIHEWRLGLKPLAEPDRRWMLANQGRNSQLTAWTPDAKRRRNITPSTFG